MQPSPFNDQDQFFLRRTLELARDNVERGDGGPFGALVARDGRIIAEGWNRVVVDHDPTAHAEILAITAAANTLGTRRLEGCTLYVTLEPCPMCAGAIVLARIPVLVFGSYDPKAGACGTLYNIVEDRRLNHTVHVVPGVLDHQCSSLLKSFFGSLRRLTPGE